jgi:hypothetical protein
MSGFHTSVRICAPFLAATALAATARPNVIVVDAGGGGNFTSIQPAVDAAVDGDTLLVKTGTYGAFVVGDKSLVIVGDASASVEVLGAARVQSLSALKTVVIENVTASGAPGTAPNAYGLYLSNDAGHVRIENCHFTGAATSSGGNGFDGVRVEFCNEVGLTRVTSVGGSAPSFPSSCCNYESGAGLRASSSTVTIYRSTLRGGNGESAGFSAPNGGSGGDGCAASGTNLFFSGSSCIGGNGGQAGPPAFGAFGGDGGDGVHLSSGSVCYLLENVETGGAPGPASPLDPLNTSPGEAGVARFGTMFIDFTGSSRRMNSPSPVRENTTFNLTFTGTPGEQVALVVSNEADYVFKLPWKGVFLVKALHPMLSVPVGTIPPGGTLTVPWGAPDLGGQPSKVLHTQPVFIDAQGHRTIGNSSVLVMLSHLY